MYLPTDKEAIAFIQQQIDLLDKMQLERTCHMAESFGRPGSMTQSGQKYSGYAREKQVLDLHGLLYSLKRGWIILDDVKMPKEFFTVNQ